MKKKSIIFIVIAIILAIVGFTSTSTSKQTDVVSKAVYVEDGKVLPKNEGEIVIVPGKLEAVTPLVDEITGVELPGVIAKKGSEKVEYTPVQSGMDGRLENSGNKVYDFTLYDFMAEFSAYDRVPDTVFCGSWVGFKNDGNGEERVLILYLEEDGYASYVYGIGNSEILEKFTGTWKLLDNDILKLELEGGVPESADDPTIHEPYDCNSSFEWEITTEGLILTHINGDEILFGTKGQTFEFKENGEDVGL